MVGIYGHRDCSNNRGAGDPGDAIMALLCEHGYESFDFSTNEDRETWMKRQEEIDLLPDGIPGPKTAMTLAQKGYPNGLWISRPGD